MGESIKNKVIGLDISSMVVFFLEAPTENQGLILLEMNEQFSIAKMLAVTK